jgi:2-dehydro-3-deoxygluconokinase
MTELVTFGETMAVLSSTRTGPLRHAESLRLGIAGAESNVAIGVRRLGREAAWIGRVGDDEFGRRIVRELRGEQLDLRGVRVDGDAPTGLMIKERRSSATTSVLYYRRGSAGSRLRPADLDTDLVAGARILHCTGITPALSASAREATFAAVEVARAAGAMVSFDPNHRAALWTAPEAAGVFRDLAAKADVVLAGEPEAEMILGARLAPDEAARRIARLGPSHAIVKLGARGAVACADGESRSAPALRVRATDPVGAGDAFAAGYLAALLAGEDGAAALAAGCAVGAWAVTVDGDWEGLPRREELSRLDADPGDVQR